MIKVTRRQFVRASGLMTVSAIAAACAPKTPTAAPTAVPKATAAPTAAAAATKVPVAAVATAAPTAAAAAATKAPAATTAPVTKYAEAPSLAELVKAGKLPPVEQRLPANPIVVDGLDGIGKYGGTWRRAFNGTGDQTGINQVLGRGFIRITEKFQIIPYMCESYEVSPDATTFTFKLRRGLKWSDGQPLTSKDTIYWFENVIKDTDITKATPSWLSTKMEDGKLQLCTVTAPDDFTVVFKFPKPSSLFYYNSALCTSLGVMQPSHYLKQFHMKLGDKAFIEKEMAAGSFKVWVDLYNERANPNYTTARPTNQPWLQTNTLRDEVVTLTRNPYFSAVDKAGNQLPYIDSIRMRLFKTPDLLVLWATNGEIDCQSRHFGFADYTVLRENEKKGDYALQMWKWSAVMALHFNMTAKEPKLRELFSARDFRIAMSLGINRDEINQLNYDGIGKPMQYGPPEGTPQYYEKLTKAYLNYDPKKADELLNNLGYKKGPDGMRTFKDGTKIQFTMMGQNPQGTDSMAVLDQMKRLGFDVVFKGVDRTLLIQQHNANEVDFTMGNADRTLIPLADPQVWIKHINRDDRAWCGAWTLWKMDPKDPNAEEPPKDHWIWTIWNTYDKMWQTADVKKRDDLFKEILEIWSVELPSIGLLGNLPKFVVVKNGFKGIKAGYDWDCCSTNYEHIIDSATWYWDDPSKHV